MKTLSELLAQVKELDANATKGPWREDNDDVLCFIEREGEECILIEAGFGFAETPDYQLIANFRTATPLLAEIVEKLIEQRNDEGTWIQSGDPRERWKKYDRELDAIVRSSFTKGMGKECPECKKHFHGKSLFCSNACYLANEAKAMGER